MQIFHALLLCLYLLFLLALGISLIVYLASLTFTRVPFISFTRKKIPEILDALRLRDDAVVYDLGCGDGRVVLEASKCVTAGRLVGVDYALAAYIAARWKYYFAGSPKNVFIRKVDFFSLDLSDASHVYCYLFPSVMQDLHRKFQKELTSGTRVVSCDFPITEKIPIEEIPFETKSFLGGTLFVYEY